jgi:hypothetical protein
MIGVMCRPSQVSAVEEFFQLFKTPWEYYAEGRIYDAIISTVPGTQDITARLLLLYGPASISRDVEMRIRISSKVSNISLTHQGSRVPIYREMLIFHEDHCFDECLATDSGLGGLKAIFPEKTVLRLGYDLFDEVEHLLSVGQPVANSSIPTLDLHIQMLRNWIIEAGIGLLEIPPLPFGSPYAVCLTHDIDFIGIRRHKFDHTMWGFLYRSTLGALRNYLKSRISLSRLIRSWLAAISLPLVHLGLVKDFWLPFKWYFPLEKDLPTTYFLIPFKNRPGDLLSADHPQRRAATYDITEIPEWTAALKREGCEIGVHGIDAWHDREQGREELKRISKVTGESLIGVRMHWLLRNENTARLLEEAGFMYDSSCGYNESIGFICGTTQIFRPLTSRWLLELPVHIQDGALFLEKRLGLSESAARILCLDLIQNFREFGGVLTIIWHDRSLGPERFWGDFYRKLLEDFRSQGAWFGTASQVLTWHTKRREVIFESIDMNGDLGVIVRSTNRLIEPPLTIRVHRPELFKNISKYSNVDKKPFLDIPWSGADEMAFFLWPR